MKKQGDRNIAWFRLLGRLHRRTMMDDDQPDEAHRSPPAPSFPEYNNDPEANIDPTDPHGLQRSAASTNTSSTDAAPTAAPAWRDVRCADMCLQCHRQLRRHPISFEKSSKKSKAMEKMYHRRKIDQRHQSRTSFLLALNDRLPPVRWCTRLTCKYHRSSLKGLIHPANIAIIIIIEEHPTDERAETWIRDIGSASSPQSSTWWASDSHFSRLSPTRATATNILLRSGCNARVSSYLSICVVYINIAGNNLL